MGYFRFAVPIWLALGAPVPALAAVDMDRFHACIDAQVEGNRPAADCVQQEHRACGDFPLETAPQAAMLCYREAQEAWTGAISARLETMKDRPEPKIAEVAGIEVKYDVLRNLLQCDRMEDLARLAGQEATAMDLQKARCAATAFGLAYARLVLSAQARP
ncbi:MAG: hypothetical protein EP318_15200 [Rhodobacteraceae bacterium]|nr:MAG: hypothetical protein EP318_15200 [Paracoccaceae bacterium]